MKSPSALSYLLTGIALAIAGTLYFQSSRTRQLLQRDRASARVHIANLEAEAKAAKAIHQTLQTQLLELDASLGAAKSKLTIAEAHKVQLSRDLAASQKQLLDQSGREQSLNREISELQGKPAKPTQFETPLADARVIEPVAPLSATLVPSSALERTASVVSVGPASAFVVLNFGSTQGALLDQNLLIRRGTLPVATVHISDVRPNHSIAQVQPGTLQAALHKGDSAVLTE